MSRIDQKPPYTGAGGSDVSGPVRDAGTPQGGRAAESAAEINARAIYEAGVALRKVTGRAGRVAAIGGRVRRQGPVAVVCRSLDEWHWVEVRLDTPDEDEVASAIIAEVELYEQPTAMAWTTAISHALRVARARIDRAEHSVVALRKGNAR